jgi:predicted nucleic acid-binding protein
VSKPVKGPASYFPSIEKKYGRPVSEWKAMIRDSDLTRHMELVAWLKAEHGLGHGHASALVAHALAEARPTVAKYVVDCGVALRLAAEGYEVPDGVELFALAAVSALPIRLLGDAVLRRKAWEVAEQLGWASTYDAEYVALTLLQADALVTLDAELARRVATVAPTATIDALHATAAG